VSYYALEIRFYAQHDDLQKVCNYAMHNCRIFVNPNYRNLINIILEESFLMA